MDYKMIEELTLNNWQPLQTLLYDGWVLRFADGYTKRANSVNPILYSTMDVHEKIAACEQIYSDRQLRTVFKITPFANPQELDQILERKGYSRVDSTSVQLLALDSLAEVSSPSASVRLDEQLTSEWIDAYCRMSGNARHRETVVRMTRNIITRCCFISLYAGDTIVACGLGVVERGYLGLFDIVTDARYRNQGYGEQLVRHLLQWGKSCGASHAHLAVVIGNTPAEKLYAKLGFREIYRYWYRVKAD